MLVYERLYHGSLDRLLYGRSDGPSIDWNTRMKIAICAAQGLTFLHEEGPFQVIAKSYIEYTKLKKPRVVLSASCICMCSLDLTKRVLKDQSYFFIIWTELFLGWVMIRYTSLCLQAMYNEFSTANIQIDKDFSAKLSGYGCVGQLPEEEIPSSSSVSSLT